AFEVGGEVLDAFRAAFGDDAPVRPRPDGKGHVDLREAVRRQLVAAGIPADQIDSTDRCTVRDAGEFFSHRRDNGVTGRMAAIISPR
ncbi:MAG: FIG00003370: Multicopper polyphenol oxidase, partial [uncultured Phycisphaerae bacterium]